MWYMDTASQHLKVALHTEANKDPFIEPASASSIRIEWNDTERYFIEANLLVAETEMRNSQLNILSGWQAKNVQRRGEG